MKKTTRRVGVTTRLNRIQSEAERAISRGYRATLELLPAGPRKAVKEFTSQLEATAENLSKRGQRALNAVERQRKTLRRRVDQAVRAVERRGERALATVEAQRTKLVATVERRAVQAVKPLARRLDLATGSDVERLGKRLAHLERRLANGTRRAAA